MHKDTKYLGILLLFFVGFGILYVANISGWLMHDDEGTDFYEVWQLQRGKQPGVDFLAEQQPLFLLAGSTIVDIAGRSPSHLRLLAAAQVLCGSLILSLAICRIWGGEAAVLTLGLILCSGMVYEQARLFRPDPMMLAWEMAGLGAALLAVKTNRRPLWALAGFCYGIGIPWKLFGILPIVGIAFFFLDLVWRNRNRWREIIVTGLFFVLPFLVVGLGISAWLYTGLGFYYLEPFEQHLGLGRGSSLFAQLAKTVVTCTYFLVVNSIFVFIVPLWRLNARKKRRESLEMRLLLLQLLSPAVFLAMTRPIYPRYFLYLIPVLAIVLAWQFQLAFSRITLQRPAFPRWIPLIILLVFGVAIITTQPSFLRLLVRQESDTLQLAACVASHTQPQDKVLSDYAGINFFANRDSIYEASIIAGGRIKGQIVTGKLLLDRIEENQVKMVLLHVAGGDPPPHQLVMLVDYDNFRGYLTEHFDLLTVFKRAGQQIEIYHRK